MKIYYVFFFQTMIDFLFGIHKKTEKKYKVA